MQSLIQYLIKKGVIDKKQSVDLDREVQKSGKREEEILLEKNAVPERTLFELKSENINVPLRSDIVAEDISFDILGVIPEESARYYRMVPIGKKGDTVEIGLVYPEDLSAQEALKFLARQGGFSYSQFLIPLGIFEQVVKRYRTFKGEVTKALGELEEELDKDKKQKQSKQTSLERLVEEAPITKVVAVLLRNAVDGHASDVHIEPTRKEVRVRLRQDGSLKTRLILPLKILPAVVARVKILSNLRIDETRVPQDGRFTTRVDDKDIDFRVSTFPTTLGEKVAIRILDPSTGLKGLPDLGLAGNNLRLVQEAIKQPFGMILSTGPTGSGKSTTLYAVLQILNKESVNVITLEDPVEYFVDGVNQSQVRPEIGYEFASGLRSILRQDPNVIMVGEIRDSETAALATHAALTGHIVLSTLHTNNAIGVIPRLIDLGVAPYLLPSTLRLAIAQRLVRRLCESCKKKCKITPEKKALIDAELNDLSADYKKDIKMDDAQLYEAVGCRKCFSTGYSGRLGLFEILQVTEDIGRMILQKPAEEEIAKAAKEQRMTTMRQDGILKVLNGLTSIEEVVRVTEDQ